MMKYLRGAPRSLIGKRVKIPYERVAVSSEHIGAVLPQSTDTIGKIPEKVPICVLTVSRKTCPAVIFESHEPMTVYTVNMADTKNKTK